MDELIREASALVSRVNEATRGVRDPDVLSELMSPFNFSEPRAVAQLLMENLAHPILGEHLDSEMKIFWAEVAAHMGSAWIEFMRTIAAFMRVVDEFEPR